MNRKKTILVFIDWFTPGYRAGGPITSCSNLIEQLKDEYNFKVITRDRDYMSDDAYDVKRDCWSHIKDGCEIYYVSPKLLSRKNLKVIIRNTEFDLMYINGMFSWYFSILPLFLDDKESMIVSPRGMLRSSALSVKGFKKKIYLIIARILGFYKGVIFHATTPEEAIDIRSQFNKNNVRVAPNMPRPFDTNGIDEKHKAKGSLNICFPGRIAREKNLKYALEVVSKINGNVQLNIAGELYDQQYWNECEMVMDELPDNISTHVLGSLNPQEFKQELKNSDVSLLPTLGENFGHAIIESLSLGSPVLISDQTPWKGLESRKAGVDIALNSKDKFVMSLQGFCDMDSNEFNDWRRNAKQYAIEEVNWEQDKEKYRQLFND